MNKYLKWVVISVFLIVSAGCATSRGVLDIQDKPVINPASGKAVKFVRVIDKRDFQINPGQPSIPSLKNNEINNKDITSRAIARKRNGFGKALGDILLPEDKTVMGVVENRVSRGFAESGYRVLTPKDKDYASAIPVEIEIQKFWGWFNPGFWSIKISFQTALKITAPIGEFENGVVVESEVQKGFQTAVGSNWQEVIDLSLEKLNNDIKLKLESAETQSK
jgi:hypothetical protein